MRRSKYHVLRVAQVLFGVMTAESPVVLFLRSISFTLDWLSRGEAMLERAIGLRDRREALRRTVKGMTDVVRSLFHSLQSEVNTFLAAAQRALAKRQDLAAAVGVAHKRKGKGHEAAQPAPAAVSAQPAPAGVSAQPAAAKEEEKPPRKGRVPPFVEKARGALGAALASEEVVSILEPYGYGREAIAGLLARVESLARTELDHEEMKKALLSLTAELNESTTEFRGWFVPTRKRLNTALKGRPELQKMLTEPQE